MCVYVLERTDCMACQEDSETGEPMECKIESDLLEKDAKCKDAGVVCFMDEKTQDGKRTYGERGVCTECSIRGYQCELSHDVDGEYNGCCVPCWEARIEHKCDVTFQSGQASFLHDLHKGTENPEVTEPAEEMEEA